MNKRTTLAAIEYHYNIACDLASKLVESEARKLMLKHPSLEEFCMGMGTWSFSHKDGRNVDDSDLEYLRSFGDIFCEWNKYLKIDGEPMRFTAKGPKITDW